MNRVLHSVVREALRELSDEDYQRRVWLAASGPEIGSMTEAVERLFDDSGLGDALDESSTTYLRETDSALNELDSLLKQMGDRRPPDVILSDPRLRRVRELAAAALKDPELRESGP